MQLFTFVYLLVKCPVIWAFELGGGGGFTTFSRSEGDLHSSKANEEIRDGAEVNKLMVNEYG